MPELPEAETIVRGLAPELGGTRLRVREVHHADVVAGDPGRFRAGVEGRRVRATTRRGKNIVLRLEAPDAQPLLHLVVNLGMSGRLLLRAPEDPTPPPTHPAVRFHVTPQGEGGPAAELVYHDVRRFGRLELMDPARWTAFDEGMGPEPLGPRFTSSVLAASLSASRMPLRSWLLDQRKVAGVGNIYASEAAWRARVHPARRGSDVPASRMPSLHRAIRGVLREAVEARGTTLRDYRTAQGWEGSFGQKLAVYGRAGAPCPRCRTPVERIVFSNRSAFLCPRCQPAEGELAPFETSAT